MGGVRWALCWCGPVHPADVDDDFVVLQHVPGEVTEALGPTLLLCQGQCADGQCQAFHSRRQEGMSPHRISQPHHMDLRVRPLGAQLAVWEPLRFQRETCGLDLVPSSINGLLRCHDLCLAGTCGFAHGQVQDSTERSKQDFLVMQGMIIRTCRADQQRPHLVCLDGCLHC